MMRITRRIGLLAVAATAYLSSHSALAVDPNPLQNTYWRFEEGTVGQRVTPRNSDVVLDSISSNELRAFQCDTCGAGGTQIDASPTYVSDVPPTALKSGLTNSLALDFIPNQDLYANAQDVNNGIIATGGGFTVEAAFRPNSVVAFQGIVAKEGRPGQGKLGGSPEENLPTFVLKIRNNGLLQTELWDGGAVTSVADNPQVSSLTALTTGQWYYAAAVGTATSLSLYLDRNDGSGYVLQGTIPLSGGALYQGDDPSNPNWDRPWVVGRAEYAGGPADWFDGIIDEVRISNTALSPSQFLFAPAVAAVAGDYNNNGVVDAADYVIWRNGGPLQNEVPNTTPGSVTAEDYTAWRARFGNNSGSGSGAAVPEPAAAISLLIIAASAFARRHR